MPRIWDVIGRVTGGMPPPRAPDAPRRPLALVGEDGQIIADLPCHRCGYDVRGLSVDGMCPECNFPVRQSVRGNILIYSDPRWLRGVARGAQWMGWAGLIGLIVAVAWLFTTYSLFSLGLFAAVVLFLIGAWMATSADPSGIDEGRCARLRVAARILLAAGLFAAPVSHLRGRAPGVESLVRATTALFLAGGFGGVLAIVRYLQRLTLRIPDGRLFAALEGYFRFLLVIVTAATVSVVIMNAFTPAVMRLPPPLICLMVLPLFVTVFASLRFFSMCRELAGHLNAQAKLAEQNWPAETRGPDDTTIAPADP